MVLFQGSKDIFYLHQLSMNIHTYLFSLFAFTTTTSTAATHPLRNILLIAIDDLRPNIGAYGHDFMKTPHIDSLASDPFSTTFTNAYVQYSFCAPSRNSFLTGRRPDVTRAFSFMNHFREVGPNWTTLPQYFKEHGYNTFGTGKLFHPGLPPNFDAPQSFDHYVFPGTCTGNTNGWPILESNVTNVECPPAFGSCMSNETGALVSVDSTGGGRWCSVDTSKIPHPLADHQVASAAIKFLDERVRELGDKGDKNKNKGDNDNDKENNKENDQKPFFLGVGFHKPHLPFQYPKNFDTWYPKIVAPPKHPNPPEGMPLCAWHEGKFDNKWEKPCNHMSEYRRAYYAAVSYTDHNIGRVLSKLDETGHRNDTAVLLIGDHGWQLGEMNEWRKMTNFELGVRVPLIVRRPSVDDSATNTATNTATNAGTTGRKSHALVEAVDIYPTLVALSGLPPSKEGLQGLDLSPLLTPSDLDDDVEEREIREQANHPYAFSQFAKRMIESNELQEKELWDVCTKCKHVRDIFICFLNLELLFFICFLFFIWVQTDLTSCSSIFFHSHF